MVRKEELIKIKSDPIRYAKYKEQRKKEHDKIIDEYKKTNQYKINTAMTEKLMKEYK